MGMNMTGREAGLLAKKLADISKFVVLPSAMALYVLYSPAADIWYKFSQNMKGREKSTP